MLSAAGITTTQQHHDFIKFTSMFVWIYYCLVFFGLSSTEGLIVDEYLEHHKFIFPFPIHGEAIMMNSCINKRCAVQFSYIGWLARGNVVGENKTDYIAQVFVNDSDFDVFETSFSISGNSPEDTIATLDIETTVPENLSYISVSLKIKHKSTNVLVHESDLILVCITPTDMGFRTPQLTHNDANEAYLHKDGVDFIEMGTSNFDTCTHQAAILVESKTLTRVRGVALEAMIQYLEALPEVPGVVKVHAAVTDRPGDKATGVYYLPESIIDKNPEVNQHNKGCTSIGSMHPNIKNLVRFGKVRSELVQKTFIRTFTVQAILQQYVTPVFRALERLGMQEIAPTLRLLKLDVERMDESIVGDVLDFYADLTQSKYITAAYPCVIYFEYVENEHPEGKFNNPLLIRLRETGYQTVPLSMLVSDEKDPDFGTYVEDDFNYMVTNPLCGTRNIMKGLLFLRPQVVGDDRDDFNDELQVATAV